MRIVKVFIALCAVAVLARSIYAQEKKEIVLGCETSLLPATVWVAENKGYFQKEGLNLKIREFDSGRAAFKEMLEKGGIDIVTVAQTPVVFNSFKRSDYAIFGMMVYSYNDVKLLARKDKGIVKPKDLKGRRIACTQGSTGHFYLGLFLNYAGIGIQEVEVMDLATKELSGALVEGTVDAISTWEPHIYNAQKQLKEKAILLPAKDIFREDFYFVAFKDFIKKEPKAIKSFLKAVEKAEQFIQKNKEESRDIVAKRLRLDKGFVSSVWDDFTYQLTLDQSILWCLEDEAKWAIKNKLTESAEVPNYLDYIYSNALEEIAPEAVTIIQ